MKEYLGQKCITFSKQEKQAILTFKAAGTISTFPHEKFVLGTSKIKQPNSRLMYLLSIKGEFYTFLLSYHAISTNLFSKKIKSIKCKTVIMSERASKPRLRISLTIDSSKLPVAEDFSLECSRDGDLLPQKFPSPWWKRSWMDSIKFH